MKKASIMHITARADWGGGPEHVLQLVTGLRNAGVLSSIVCPKCEPYWSRYKRILPDDRLLEIASRKVRLRDILRIASHLVENDVRVLHLHGFGAGVIGLLIKFLRPITTVLTLHGAFFPRPDGESFLRRLLRWLLGCVADRIIAVADGELTHAQRMSTGSRKVALCYNGVACPDKLPPLPDRKLVLSVSRFDFQKDTSEELAIVAEAYKIVPDIRYVLYGEGSEKASLEDAYAELVAAGVVRFAGTTAALRQAMSNANLFLSSSRWEGLPLAVLEAMSEGMTVLLSDVPGHRELAKRCNSVVLYEKGNILAAAQKLRSLIADTARRQEIRENVWMTIKRNYSIEVMVQRTIAVYGSDGLNSFVLI